MSLFGGFVSIIADADDAALFGMKSAMSMYGRVS